ncbi:MFS transporter [Streptomyces griseofuscus]|uniref:MFS transporter n=1 Tax=Streptomyces griseofuscus TaxID=146922 RepID=UPI0036A61E89
MAFGARSKQNGLLLSQAAFVAGSFAPAAGGRLGAAGAAVLVAALGTAFAVLQLFAPSMVPDAVVAAETRGGARAGAGTGVWTATEAAGTALGHHAYATVLALGGFVSTTGSRSVRQSHAAHLGLLLGITVVPAVFTAVAMAYRRRCRPDRC